MTQEQPEFISYQTDSRGKLWMVDRRRRELQPDGTTVLRDPVTGKAYDPNTGKLLDKEK